MNAPHPPRDRLGRNVLPGQAAREFVRSKAVEHGEDPDIVLSAIKRSTPLGRLVLALLHLRREDVFPIGRPLDTPRAEMIRRVVDDLRDRGVGEDVLWNQAAKYLAEPNLRLRHRVGGAGPAILGKGRQGRPMAPDAVREAYASTDRLVGALWFDGSAAGIGQPE